MPSDPGVVAAVAAALEHAQIDLAALGLAWARVTPTVVLVPAFGMRALPGPGRVVLALALAASVFPALVPVVRTSSGPWALLAGLEVARGLPVAIATAVPLWAATMAGGVADALRGAREAPAVPVVEGGATPLGVLLSLLASAIFLATGGPARVALALIEHPVAGNPALAAADDLVAGIALAVSLGGPLLAAAVVIEVASALVARSATPAQVHTLLAPVRALGTLAVLGIVLHRLAAALGRAVQSVP